MGRSWRNGIVVIGLVALQAACTDRSTSAPDQAVPRGSEPLAGASLEIGVPERANAHVSIAAAGPFVVLAWSAADASGAADVYSSVSHDSGRTFSTPVRVNTTQGTVRVSGEQPPRIALGPRSGGEPSLTIIWTAQGAAGTTLMTAQSEDGGRSFASEELVSGTDAPGNRGWESLAALAGGRVVAAWLDHRQLADNGAAASAHDHHDETDGVAMAQRSQLYFAALDGVPRPLTGGVCYCCKTALGTGMLDDSDAVAVAWRHVYPGNLRDIAFTLSRDGGRTFSEPVRVSEDQWSIAGCPDDGPAMAVDGRGRVHLVWPTAVTENGQPAKALFHAMTSDGVSFSPRVQLPTEGQANHPQIGVAPDGALAVIWDESGSGARHIAAAFGRAQADGEVRFERQPPGGAIQGLYPVVTPVGDGLLAAWTSGPPDRSMIRVTRF